MLTQQKKVLQKPLVQQPLLLPQPDRLHHLLKQLLPVQRLHRRRLVKHLTVLFPLRPQKMRQIPVPVQLKRQKRMQQLHKDQPQLLLKLQQRRLLKQALVRLTLLNQLLQLLRKQLLLLIRLQMLQTLQLLLEILLQPPPKVKQKQKLPKQTRH